VRYYGEHVEEHIKNLGNILGTHWELKRNIVRTHWEPRENGKKSLPNPPPPPHPFKKKPFKEENQATLSS
jgi:hypothetical protein